MASQGGLVGNPSSCGVCQGDRRMNLLAWKITGALNMHFHPQVTEEERRERQGHKLSSMAQAASGAQQCQRPGLSGLTQGQACVGCPSPWAQG